MVQTLPGKKCLSSSWTLLSSQGVSTPCFGLLNLVEVSV